MLVSKKINKYKSLLLKKAMDKGEINLRILVVDDSQYNLFVMKELLG